MTAPELSYVALVVDEPETSAAIFEKDFGLPREDFSCGDRNVPAISVGRSALAFFRADDPFLGADARKGVHHLAIGSDDPAAAAAASGIATVNGVSDGLGGRPQIELSRDATCGVRTRLTPTLGLAPASSDLVERIDHLASHQRTTKPPRMFSSRSSAAFTKVSRLTARSKRSLKILRRTPTITSSIPVPRS